MQQRPTLAPAARQISPLAVLAHRRRMACGRAPSPDLGSSRGLRGAAPAVHTWSFDNRVVRRLSVVKVSSGPDALRLYNAADANRAAGSVDPGDGTVSRAAARAHLGRRL